MDEEAADELVSTQCHRFLFGVATIILPLEANLAVLDIEDAIVGDGDTVCVAADVLQDLLWSGERALGIDHPFSPTHRGEVTLEGGRLVQVSQGGEERQRAGAEGFLQGLGKKPPEQPRENPHRQKIAGSAGDPSAAIRRQPAAGDNHVKMRVETPTPTIP
jgi:hypothetical protein